MSHPTFKEIFGVLPDAVGRAPGRVNMLGDHTDYNEGYVLPTAIPQRTTVEIGRGSTFPHCAYSEVVGKSLPFDAGSYPDFTRYVGGCVALLARNGVSIPPLRLRVASEVPLGIGLSSSAALEVATLRALNQMLGLALAPRQIAHLAQDAEIEFAGVRCGIMDQMACSLASGESMLFLDTRTEKTLLVPLAAGAEVVVIDSGLTRELSSSAYNIRRSECFEAAHRLGLRTLRDVVDPNAVEQLEPPYCMRARHVVSENARVLAALNADAECFGRLMNQSHESLSRDFEVTVPDLDGLVAFLQKQPTVFGARMTGGGFGGAVVALVKAGTSALISDALCQGPSPGARMLVPASDQTRDKR